MREDIAPVCHPLGRTARWRRPRSAAGWPRDGRCAGTRTGARHLLPLGPSMTTPPRSRAKPSTSGPLGSYAATAWSGVETKGRASPSSPWRSTVPARAAAEGSMRQACPRDRPHRPVRRRFAKVPQSGTSGHPPLGSSGWPSTAKDKVNGARPRKPDETLATALAGTPLATTAFHASITRRLGSGRLGSRRTLRACGRPPPALGWPPPAPGWLPACSGIAAKRAHGVGRALRRCLHSRRPARALRRVQHGETNPPCARVRDAGRADPATRLLPGELSRSDAAGEDRPTGASAVATSSRSTICSTKSPSTFASSRTGSRSALRRSAEAPWGPRVKEPSGLRSPSTRSTCGTAPATCEPSPIA